MGIEFTPVFLLILIAISLALVTVALSLLIGPKRTNQVKGMPYESGMDPVGDARQRFDVRFHVVAIIFLLFDVELLFLYPWAVAQWSVKDQAAPVVASASAGDGSPVVDTPAPTAVAAHTARSDAATPERPTATAVERAQAKATSQMVDPDTVGIPPDLRWLIFLLVVVVVVVLTAADAYAWRKGVFEWR